MRRLLFLFILLPFFSNAQTTVPSSTDAILLDIDNILMDATRDSGDAYIQYLHVVPTSASVLSQHQWSSVTFLTHDSLCNNWIVVQSVDFGAGVAADPYALLSNWKSYNSAFKHTYQASTGEMYTDDTINDAIRRSLRIGASLCP